jgi:hypothetical protein
MFCTGRQRFYADPDPIFYPDPALIPLLTKPTIEKILSVHTVIGLVQDF